MPLRYTNHCQAPEKSLHPLCRQSFWPAVVALWCCVFGNPLQAAERPIVFQGGTILTATGAEISPGVLIIQAGKILTVGDASTLLPADAEVIDCTGKYLIPGLVDTHSHLGVYSRPAVGANSDGNESTAPVQTAVRALDALNPQDPGIRMAVAGGITTANIMPGSANVIGGQTVYVKLRGRTAEEMVIEARDVLGGLKMANGENPKRSYGGRGQAPGTRMKVAALQRAEFVKARNYQQQWERYRTKLKEYEALETPEGSPPVPPDRDLSLEPLIEVLDGRRTVHFHSHRADDILTTLRLRDEFGFDLVIQHGTESYKVLDEIARRQVPVSMTILDSPGGKAEVVRFIEECGAELEAAGVKVIINTDDPVTESRLLLRTAATAFRGGLSETGTLQAITLHAAEALHLDHRLGSLEPGKDADIVILSGRPFSVYTRVLATYIDGQKHFDATDESQLRYQVGGFAVPQELQSPLPGLSVPAEPAPAQPQPRQPEPAEAPQEYLVWAGRVYPVSGPPIDNGIVHVRNGEIVAVGPRPADFPALPVYTAAAVTPGLIDAYCVAPLSGEYNIPADQDADEESDINQADVRVIDAFHPGEPLLRFLLEQGVTVVHAGPGRRNVVAGTTGIFRTAGRTVEDMTIRFPQAMLFNLGESSKGHGPKTRMGTAAALRKALQEAAKYRDKQQRALEKEEPFDRDLKQEQLAQVIQGELLAFICAERSDDLLTALRIGREFGLNTQLGMATEGYLMAAELQQAGVPIILHPTMQRLGNLETYHSSFANAALLANRQIPLAISSGVESYVPKTRVVRYEAALAATYGLGHAAALRSITLSAAEILNIADRYGSLEPGKQADLVLYNADPFEYSTHVTHVFIAGQLQHRRGTTPRVPLAERQYISSGDIPCCTWW
jgi:imidazolonepropionase-like amidohydrolase